MPVTTQDRPLDTVRAETIDQLILNYGHGKLSLDAFENRLDRALDAQSHISLSSLTEDLDLLADQDYTKRKRRELGLQTIERSGKNIDYMVNICGGSNRGGPWTVGTEIRMFNLFGGGEIDFSQASFSSPRTIVRVFCLFGGARIYVPEGTNTLSRAFCIFGGIDNRAPSSDDPNAPTLIIDGLAICGGAKIRVRRTLKERLLEFANSVKNMFASTH